VTLNTFICLPHMQSGKSVLPGSSNRSNDISQSPVSRTGLLPPFDKGDKRKLRPLQFSSRLPQDRAESRFPKRLPNGGLLGTPKARKLVVGGHYAKFFRVMLNPGQACQDLCNTQMQGHLLRIQMPLDDGSSPDEI
jgi:hypothetical protein